MTAWAAALFMAISAGSFIGYLARQEVLNRSGTKFEAGFIVAWVSVGVGIVAAITTFAVLKRKVGRFLL